MNLEIYPEICCEVCNETIHNHFDCPSCKKEYAGTSIYGSVYEMSIGEELACEECGAVFILLNDKYPFDWKTK